MILGSESDLKKLADELEADVYRDFKNQCKTEDTYYNRNYSVEVAEGYPIIHPETPTIAINQAATQVDTTNIRIEVPPRNDSAKAEQQAHMLRRALLGFWHSIYTNQGLVLHDAAKSEFQYGVTFLKLVYDPDPWKDRPLIKKKEGMKDFEKRLGTWREQTRGTFPFYLNVVNPQNVMPDPRIFRASPEFYVEKYKKYARDIRRRWPDWTGSEKDNALIDWIEYWDKDHVVYVCGDKVIQEATEHNYGFIPYVFAEAGYGYQSADCKPEERWRGLLYPLHDDIEEEAIFESMIAAILKSSAYPQTYLWGDDDQREALVKVQETWAAHPNVLNVLAVGEGASRAQIKQVEPFRIPPEAWNMMTMRMQRLQSATVDPVLTGAREQGVRAGYEVAMRAGLAKRTYGPALFSLERACEQIGERFLMLVENVVQDTVTLWAKTPAEIIDQSISPRDINGYYLNRVMLASVSPEEEDRMANLGRVLKESGLISLLRAKTQYLKEENPFEDIEQIWIEQVLQSPNVMAAIEQAILGTEELKSQAEMITGEGMDNFPSTGHRGMPPQTFPRPDEMQRTGRPVMPGTPEETELRARQVIEPGGYTGSRPWPL